MPLGLASRLPRAHGQLAVPASQGPWGSNQRTWKELPALLPGPRGPPHLLRDDEKVDEAKQGSQDERKHDGTGEILILELVVLGDTETCHQWLRLPGDTAVLRRHPELGTATVSTRASAGGPSRGTPPGMPRVP